MYRKSGCFECQAKSITFWEISREWFLEGENKCRRELTSRNKRLECRHETLLLILNTGDECVKEEIWLPEEGSIRRILEFSG